MSHNNIIVSIIRISADMQFYINCTLYMQNVMYGQNWYMPLYILGIVTVFTGS